MGRLLRPVDIASTVGHLLSDASAMITGTIVDLHPELVSNHAENDSSRAILLRRYKPTVNVLTLSFRHD